jgi:hypothetical protein
MELILITIVSLLIILTSWSLIKDLIHGHTKGNTRTDTR